MKRRMVIIHVTDIANPNGNGVAIAVSDYLNSEGRLAYVASYNLGKEIASDNAKHFSSAKYLSIEYLPKPYNKPDLVIFNEVYKPNYIRIYKWCLANNVPYLVIPHGCLTKGSQKRKKIKKIIGNLFLFRKFICKAVCVQFLSKNEMDESAIKGRKNIVFGNGIKTVSFKTSKPTNKNLIYIGRYEITHKGLDILVNISANNKRWFIENDISIELYGRDSSHELTNLKRLIEAYDVSDIVKINGPIYGSQKEDTLKRAYCYIQCSRFEGQPMSIIEAMANGIPCIVTKGTNFASYINENRCGVGCNNDAEIFSAIKSICDDYGYREELSKNAMKAAKNDYLLSSLAKKKIAAYKELVK